MIELIKSAGKRGNAISFYLTTIFTSECANIYAHNKNVFIYVQNNLLQIEYDHHYEGNII